MNPTTFITPVAIANADEAQRHPERIVTVQMHLIDLFNLQTFTDYYCKNAKQHFDSGPHSFKHKDLIIFLRNTIQSIDPEYAQQMFDQMEQLKYPAYDPTTPTERVIVREVHHHHYEKQRPSPFGGRSPMQC